MPPTFAVSEGLYVWTITLLGGEVRTCIGSSLATLINGSLPVISAVRGAAFDPAAVPAPVVTSLTPATAVVGAPNFTLSVKGTGFVPGSRIVFNGFEEPTTYVSATELTTGVNMAVWTAPSAPLPVAVRALDGEMSNAMNFTFTATE